MDHHQSHLSRVVFFLAATFVSATTFAADPKPAAPSEPAASAPAADKPAPPAESAVKAAPEIQKENPGAKAQDAAVKAHEAKAPDLKPLEKSVYDFDKNFLGHVSLGVLNLLNLGLAYAPTAPLEYGVQGGWLGVRFGSYSLTEWNIDALVRWHPFKGAFYLSTGLRYISLQFGFPPSVLGVADPVGGTIINANAARWEGLAVMGWRWIMGKFTIGFDFGVGIPFSYSGGVTVNSTLSQNPLTAGQVTSLETDGTTALRGYLGYVEPIINFLKIGWKF